MESVPPPSGGGHTLTHGLTDDPTPHAGGTDSTAQVLLTLMAVELTTQPSLPKVFPAHQPAQEAITPRERMIL
jgi:hypothetical protein